MPTISLLTACLPSRTEHLVATADSVERAQKDLMGEVDVQWIIALDGPGRLPSFPQAHEIITIERHSGVATTRNMALSLASGDYCMALDADDLLEAEGIHKAIQLFSQRTVDQAAWIAGNRLTIEGEHTRHWHGRNQWGAKYLAWDWTSPFPFHSNTVVYRLPVLWEIGGWPAMPVCEDVGLVLEVSERYGGLAIREVMARGRTWEGQHEKSLRYLQEKAASYAYVEQLLNFARKRSRDPLIAAPPIDVS